MRSIKKIHKAVNAPIEDLITWRAMPSGSIQYLDPFLFLNHHGPQVYEPNNDGLPFGPHPHRGFETLTFVLQGDIMHWDSSGSKSVIGAGGIQWMTAGSGLIHSEVSSEEFKKNGGEEEVIQLWFNLPAKYKMTPPNYIGLQRDEIPHIQERDGDVLINLISGRWKDQSGPINSLTDLMIASVEMSPESGSHLDIPVTHNILFYVVKGHLVVNGRQVETHQLVEFDHNSERIEFAARTESVILLGHAAPLKEPIVAQGPFVMNSPEEIRQAFADYQSGKMGTWNG